MSISGTLISQEMVAPRSPWGGQIATGDILVLTDLEGQQAVDFLCFDDENRSDRYSSTNTLKVQGNVFVSLGSVLYTDSGKPLMTVVHDDIGSHDTIYGCCSNPNNALRYGVITTESCYTNFEQILATYNMGRESIVPNINWFMSVPVLPDGSAGVANSARVPGSQVALRAECNVLAVLSNCPQMHNPCNGYNPTPIEVQVIRPEQTD